MKKPSIFRFKSITHRLIFSCVVSAIAIYGFSYWNARQLIKENVGIWLIYLGQYRVDSIANQIEEKIKAIENSSYNLPYQISALLKPARIVGGDLYDFFLLGSDRLCLIIGDVADKGFPAALLMARTVTLIRTLTKPINTPSEILYTVNQELCADNEECLFVTLFCGIITLDTGIFTYASGGHNAHHTSLTPNTQTLTSRKGQVHFIHLTPQVKKVFDIVKAVPLSEVFSDTRELDAYLEARQAEVK